MKSVTKYFFLLILLSGTLVSCDPAKQFSSEISEIDSCLAQLDSLETLYDGIEFDSLKLMVEHVEQNEKLIKEYYQPDTLNEDFGRQMNDSKAIRKALKNVSKDQLVYGDELNAVKHQFMDLKEDILNGVLTDEQVAEYLTVEKAALKNVNLAFGGFYAMQKAEKHRYYVVVPKVDAFIEQLKAQGDETE